MSLEDHSCFYVCVTKGVPGLLAKHNLGTVEKQDFDSQETPFFQDAGKHNKTMKFLYGIQFRI